jgi:lysophospholipase L1-like esterase
MIGIVLVGHGALALAVSGGVLTGQRADQYTYSNVKIITYIAPIRNDVPLPYDLAEYGEWKLAVEELSRNYGATHINLEKLVPAELWGNYFSNDIDFMHFRGQGHQLLARALLPYVDAARRK